MYPALINAIPAIVLVYFLNDTPMADIVKYLMTLTVSAAIVWTYTVANQLVGRDIFERRYFKDKLHMPTTNFLLSNDRNLSTNMKQKIKKKVKTDFGINLPTSADEARDMDDSRKQIDFAVSQIRNKMRGNSMLLQHNYEYGFVRNFIGGSVFAFCICLAGLFVFHSIKPNKWVFYIYLILGALHISVICLSKWLINRYGSTYARVLFEQYLQA